MLRESVGPLDPQGVERVLEALGFSVPPALDLEGLTTLYGRWCRRVPFDNVRKRIAIVEGYRGPLPGDDPAEFFRSWLDHGTGGTCWAGNGALCSLLTAVGFPATRGIGTMLPTPEADVPPNHGTVTVALDRRRYLVDASMLHDRPLELDQGCETVIEHGAWGIRARWERDRLMVRWHPLRTDTMDCRIETLESSPAEFRERHEAARTRSGFNFQLTARILRGQDVQAVVMGDWMTRTAAGEQRRRPLLGQDRIEFMTRILGLSEEISLRLPPDEPVPAHLRAPEDEPDSDSPSPGS